MKRSARSATVKQFLLRVHPDHFRNIPKVHDENLQSMQLLNQFMDESRGAYSVYSGSRSKVFFSAYVPRRVGDHRKEEAEHPPRLLKRFPLALAGNVENDMRRILVECGVQVAEDEASSSSADPSTGSSTFSRHTSDQERPWEAYTRNYQSPPRSDGMDFGADERFADFARSNGSRRRKRAISSISAFLMYAQDPATLEKQQQRRRAWLSIQSVQRTLRRELGLREVATSCGWASVPLNATLMTLLKTLRKLSKTSYGVNGLCRGDILRDARLDVSSEASAIDFYNEYTIVLNVADVPLQWVDVLESVDEDMLQYMRAARESLARLQQRAEQAMGGGVTIVRGRSCSAIAYRGFLQEMATSARCVMADPQFADQAQGSRSRDAPHKDGTVVEIVTLVVEDSAMQCEILDDGRVRAPSCHSAEHVIEFLQSNRRSVQDRVAAYADETQQFELVAQQCVLAWGITSLTFGEGLRLADVNEACSALLRATTDTSADNSGSRGRDRPLRDAPELISALRGHTIRIARSYGLAQDGVFTIPVDWHR